MQLFKVSWKMQNIQDFFLLFHSMTFKCNNNNNNNINNNNNSFYRNISISFKVLNS